MIEEFLNSIREAVSSGSLAFGVEWVSVSIATIATLGSFFLSASLRSSDDSSKSKALETTAEEELTRFVAGEEDIDLEKIDFEEVCRLASLKRLKSRSEKQARRSALSYNLLVVGQYIIGALLASSFVQATTGQDIVGALGVLVLLSAAVQQRFRPDVLANQARIRSVKCAIYIREIEDEIFDLRLKRVSGSHLIFIRRRATLALNELDENEQAGSAIYSEARRVPEES